MIAAMVRKKKDKITKIRLLIYELEANHIMMIHQRIQQRNKNKYFKY